MFINLLGMVVHTCNPNYWGGRGRQFEASLGKKVARLHLKNKRTGDMTQVVEHLSTMQETPGLVPESETEKTINK
jgi:hypothetical protein